MAERVKKTLEMKLAELDEKIARHQDEIKKLESKKQALMDQQDTKKKEDFLAACQKSGKSFDEILELLK